MDKTDKPKSVREILEEIWKRATIGYPPDDKLGKERTIAQALTDIYSLLGEDIKDKDCAYNKKWQSTYPKDCENIGWNNCNAAWRKHLQERLK